MMERDIMSDRDGFMESQAFQNGIAAASFEEPTVTLTDDATRRLYAIDTAAAILKATGAPAPDLIPLAKDIDDFLRGGDAWPPPPATDEPA